MQHFEFLKFSKEWALKKQEHGSFMNVMETFKSLEFKINPKHLIAYDYNKNTIKYKFNKLKINDIPLKVGDKLYTEENIGNENIISKIIGSNDKYKTQLVDNIKRYEVISIDDKFVTISLLFSKLELSMFEKTVCDRSDTSR